MCIDFFTLGWRPQQRNDRADNISTKPNNYKPLNPKPYDHVCHGQLQVVLGRFGTAEPLREGSPQLPG